MQLVFEQGPRAGQAVPLEGKALTIGRGRETDLTLPVEGISRQHARLQREPQGWALIDLGSTNGTYVNGQRLPPRDPYLLRPGDQVAIGGFVLRVEGHALPAEPPEPDLFDEEVPARRPSPALMVVGAVALVVVLAGIVLLIVTLLQPEPGPVTPTVAGPAEQFMTALPVPTEMQGVMATIMPALPSGLPLFPLGPQETPDATPTPEAALPGQEMAGPPHTKGGF